LQAAALTSYKCCSIFSYNHVNCDVHHCLDSKAWSKNEMRILLNQCRTCVLPLINVSCGDTNQSTSLLQRKKPDAPKYMGMCCVHTDRTVHRKWHVVAHGLYYFHIWSSYIYFSVIEKMTGSLLRCLSCRRLPEESLCFSSFEIWYSRQGNWRGVGLW
jgi:hypothetical protein